MYTTYRNNLVKRIEVCHAWNAQKKRLFAFQIDPCDKMIHRSIFCFIIFMVKVWLTLLHGSLPEKKIKETAHMESTILNLKRKEKINDVSCISSF